MFYHAQKCFAFSVFLGNKWSVKILIYQSKTQGHKHLFLKNNCLTLGINSNSNYMYIQSNLYWKALLIFSGHPVLRGRWSKSWICFPFITAISFSIKQSWSPLSEKTACFYCLPPVLNGHLEWNHLKNIKDNVSSKFESLYFFQNQSFVLFCLPPVLNGYLIKAQRLK